MGKRKETKSSVGGLPPKDEWQRYTPTTGRGSTLTSTISISATGTMTISADLAEHLAEAAFVVLAAWPGGPVEKKLLMIEPCTGEEPGALKGQIDDNGVRRFSVGSRVHQFGIDTPGQGQRIPARWDAAAGVIVGDLTARTLRPAPRERAASSDQPPAAASGPPTGTRKGGPQWDGYMNCPGCGKYVAWRTVDGVRKVRAHKAPDGVECLGEDYDDGD